MKSGERRYNSPTRPFPSIKGLANIQGAEGWEHAQYDHVFFFRFLALKSAG